VVPQALVAAACVVAASVCGMRSTLLLWKLVDAVNRRVPDSERISPYWWYGLKYRRAIVAYRREFPEGRLDRQLRTLSYAMGLCAGGMALSIGFGAFAALWLAGGVSVATWLVHR
jgi:fatty acid desaturase